MKRQSTGLPGSWIGSANSAGYAKPDCPRYFWDWDGPPPDQDRYRPEFAEPATHYQMYENTSEGSPLSPVFATPEEVARYCADHEVSFFGGTPTTYEHWLAIATGRHHGLPEFIEGRLK